MKAFEVLDKKFELRGMRGTDGDIIVTRTYRSSQLSVIVTKVKLRSGYQTRVSVKKINGNRMDYGEILSAKDMFFEADEAVGLFPGYMCQRFVDDPDIVQFMELPKKMVDIVNRATTGCTIFKAWEAMPNVKHSRPESINGWEYIIVKTDEWWLSQDRLDSLMADVWGSKRGFQILTTSENDRRRDHRQILWRKSGFLLPSGAEMK